MLARLLSAFTRFKAFCHDAGCEGRRGTEEAGTLGKGGAGQDQRGAFSKAPTEHVTRPTAVLLVAHLKTLCKTIITYVQVDGPGCGHMPIREAIPKIDASITSVGNRKSG